MSIVVGAAVSLMTLTHADMLRNDDRSFDVFEGAWVPVTQTQLVSIVKVQSAILIQRTLG